MHDGTMTNEFTSVLSLFSEAPITLSSTANFRYINAIAINIDDKTNMNCVDVTSNM